MKNTFFQQFLVQKLPSSVEKTLALSPKLLHHGNFYKLCNFTIFKLAVIPLFFCSCTIYDISPSGQKHSTSLLVTSYFRYAGY